MDHFDDNEIGKLLRLKKFEQPPPGYFESFLHEFHRRQRDELLRQPLWSVFAQRLSGSFFRLNIPSLTSYPAALAVVVVCAAVISLKVYQSPHRETFTAQSEASLPVAAPPVDELTLDSPMSVTSRSLGPELSRQFAQSAQTHRATTPPRYVLDRLPVSYEPSFNF